MSKKLIVDVSCANELFDDAPDHFSVELSPETIQRAKMLSEKVKELNLYSMSEFDYSGSYFSSVNLDALLTEHDIETSSLTEAMIDSVEDDTSRMDCNMLVVYEDCIRFKAVPKHCGDSETCKTPKIPLSELDNPDPFVALSY